MKKHSSIYQPLLLLSVVLISFVTLSYYLIWDAARQASLLKTTQFYYHIRQEISDHIARKQKSFEHILTDSTNKNVSYQVMIITPEAQTFIHQFRREDQPNVSFFSLPYWRSANPNESAITLESDYMLGYTALNNTHQLYVQIYYPPLICNGVAYIGCPSY